MVGGSMGFHDCKVSNSHTVRVNQVFVMGGRIAWVHADTLFNDNKTAVHLFNEGSHAVSASNVCERPTFQDQPLQFQ